MGVYTKSKYRKAASEYECRNCGATIKPGDRYLNYSPSQGTGYYQNKICLPCSTLRTKYDGPRYPCAAVNAELGR